MFVKIKHFINPLVEIVGATIAPAKALKKIASCLYYVIIIITVLLYCGNDNKIKYYLGLNVYLLNLYIYNICKLECFYPPPKKFPTIAKILILPRLPKIGGRPSYKGAEIWPSKASAFQIHHIIAAKQCFN